MRLLSHESKVLISFELTQSMSELLIKSLSATLPTPRYIKLLFQNVNRLDTVTWASKLEPLYLDYGAQEMGSTPYPGTIQDLTFNLFSILADNRLLANALFWITVWITAEVQGPWTTDRGYWSTFLLQNNFGRGGGA